MLIEVDSSVTRILGSGESTKNKVGIQTGGFEGESQDAREILKFYTKFSSKNLLIIYLLADFKAILRKI